MVVKLDLANSFDRVRHNFLLEVMSRFGFDPMFIRWVKSHISEPWIASLVNGRDVNFFKSSRGIHLGLPPFSSSLCNSSLCPQFSTRKMSSRVGFDWFKDGQDVKEMNHAQFVDDTLLLGGSSPQIDWRFKTKLDCYCSLSGSKINFKKSQIFSWNVSPRDLVEISRIIEIQGVPQWDSFKYLGIPIFKAAPKDSGLVSTP
jgi:hypothetical protein